jgi:anti-anti-sigma factor
MHHLQFNISTDGPSSVVEVQGEVDAATAPELLQTVELVHECDRRDVVIDLEGVTFIDSRGVASLVLARGLLEERCARLRIRNPRAFVAKVLDIAGVAEHLGLRDETAAPA